MVFETNLTVGCLFGEASFTSGHIWSTANDIPLCAIHEKMLGNAELAIIPTGPEGELKVIILDEDEIRRSLGTRSSPREPHCKDES